MPAAPAVKPRTPATGLPTGGAGPMHDKVAPPSSFLTGGGEMGALMRAHDWSSSPLGPPEYWPQSLRTVVSLMLTSKFPMFVAWGPQLAFLYNDGYVPIFGAKHPHALGLPFREVWSDIWTDIEPLVTKALAGEASFHEDLHLVMERNGYPEDTWYTFSYSPVRDETGEIAGMFCACTETTQEVKSRATLKAEQDRLRELFQQAPGFMAMLRGREHVFELANDAYLQLVGHRRDIVGKPAREALPEVQGQGFFELLDQVYSSGEPFLGRSLRVGLQRKPGTPAEERFVDVIYQPVTDKGGQVTGIFAEGYDVTERVQAEESLRESEARFRNLADNAPVMVWVTEPDGTCIYLSRSWYEFTGQTPETGLGFGWLNAVHPDDSGWSGEAFRASNAAHEPFRVEYRLRRADGTYRWAIDAAAPRFSEDGTYLGYVGSVLDITDRKEIEDRLSASAAEFRTLTNAAPALVWASANDGSIIYMNERWHEYTGQRVEDAIGFGWTAMMHPEDAKRILPYWQHCRETGETYEGEARYRRRDGEYRWHTFRALPHAGPDGAIEKWFGLSVDIHERKQWDEHRELLINELNHRVKNTLAIVQSMASQSLRQVSEENRPQAKAFEDRLFALARAHDVLTRENWEGAELREIIKEVVEPYLRQKTKHIEIEGPRLRLIPRTALAIAMATHELATNAAKYGALSVPSGCVFITWTITSDEIPRLELRWQERDGPPVVAPTRRGFGTRLIERSLATDVGGDVRLTYEPAGVVCVMNVPLSDEGGAADHPSRQ
ncbi:PAS domain S-box protein [Microvirga splendida]|uniref:Blue-light-activated histidine kinase n=1 Tax=Microvirga splendida TaxID=2795727 RepID=A0ABS0XZJ5_9HYPH|nr:PAS domain S-box protein [Microvirga splendida]MBJ6125118.1 PAS domain S-box protein [Microvirga splendida]